MLCLNNLDPTINLPSKMGKKSVTEKIVLLHWRRHKRNDKFMCRSPAEHKKLTNFEYVLSVELQTVKFSLGYVTVVGQYEFRQFNQVLSKLRKKADLFLRSVLFESLKLNLLSPRATLV